MEEEAFSLEVLIFICSRFSLRRSASTFCPSASSARDSSSSSANAILLWGAVRLKVTLLPIRDLLDDVSSQLRVDCLRIGAGAVLRGLNKGGSSVDDDDDDDDITGDVLAIEAELHRDIFVAVDLTDLNGLIDAERARCTGLRRAAGGVLGMGW